jgi:hypothetical protein
MNTIYFIIIYSGRLGTPFYVAADSEDSAINIASNGQPYDDAHLHVLAERVTIPTGIFEFVKYSEV